ncbi:DUF3817 domain-containing protein [uncultured Roseobacter sp.]|uniref:DUF3817 domain-containing protein n=1 Tax=uncultured Roseobacter sp. TaxID=114847 RepID=UPI002602AD18|nr:DUF3817 domain-containing protein [uncultured Roseobacter sp.]
MITSPLGRLRIAGWVEGTTLILLLFLAVPLKYFSGSETPVSLLGPIHGGCFSLYLMLACATIFDGTWERRHIARVLGAAVLPFGTFANDPFLAARMREATVG